MRKIRDIKSGVIYTLEFEKVVEHDRLNDSYILWKISSEELGESFNITQYYYAENLKDCLEIYNYEILEG